MKLVLQADEWTAEAACKGQDPNIWHPTPTDTKRGITAIAKQICATCTVNPDCLNYALRNNIDEGIYGGKTARERRIVARERRRNGR